MTISPRTLAKIKALARCGNTLRRIGAAVGLTAAGVQYHLDKHGLRTCARAARRERIITARQQGQSIAAIAAAEGLHASTDLIPARSPAPVRSASSYRATAGARPGLAPGTSIAAGHSW